MRYLKFDLVLTSLFAVMGAVIEKGKDACLVLEYMEKGSLYDILHNQTAIIEKDLFLPLMQDIISGIRFLHAADPAVVHGDLKVSLRPKFSMAAMPFLTRLLSPLRFCTYFASLQAKNILVNKSFRAKVSTSAVGFHYTLSTLFLSINHTSYVVFVLSTRIGRRFWFVCQETRRCSMWHGILEYVRRSGSRHQRFQRAR